MTGGNRFKAFLLKGWVETAAPTATTGPTWRYGVTIIGRERRQVGFVDLDSALAFLRNQFQAANTPRHRLQDTPP